MPNFSKITALTEQRAAALNLARQLMGEIAAEYGKPARILQELMLSAYSTGELRRALGYVPGGASLEEMLPGPEASQSEIAMAAACLLMGQADTDGVNNMFARIREDRPFRKDIPQYQAAMRAEGYTWRGLKQ